MEQKNQTYKIINVILLESLFTRSTEVNYSSPDFETYTDIDIDIREKDNNLFVALTLKYIAGLKNNEQKEINSLIKMLGIFESSNPTLDSGDKFGQINAPAIIFPFIREHLATMSIKSGLNPILLTPINFVALAEKGNKKTHL